MISTAFVDPVTKEQRELIDETFYMAVKALEQKPKTGQWIRTDKRIKDNLYVWKVTCCGREFIADADLKSRDNYCLNCGAKIESEEERKPKVYQCGCGTIVMNKTAREVEAESEE